MQQVFLFPAPFIHRKAAKDAEIIFFLIFAETPKIKTPHPSEIIKTYIFITKVEAAKQRLINSVTNLCLQGMVVYLDRRLSDQDKRNKLCDLCVFAVK
ncbi:hypothetical protein OAT93_00500 [bacterium]|nr:hypothetical protein [bacterium]